MDRREALLLVERLKRRTCDPEVLTLCEYVHGTDVHGTIPAFRRPGDGTPPAVFPSASCPVCAARAPSWWKPSNGRGRSTGRSAGNSTKPRRCGAHRTVPGCASPIWSAMAGRDRAKAQGVRFGRPPSLNAERPWSASRRAPRRQSWPAPTASRSRPLAGWLRPALSRQARSAREEAEVNETWQLVSGIAADW